MPAEQHEHKKLSDELLGNLLSAVGNHEVKALVLWLMKPGHSYSAGDLRRELRAAQTTPVGWDVGHSVAWGYCKETLEPLGLVAPEAMNSDLIPSAYAVTPLGEECGKPLAGALLNFSETHACSPIKLFGGTAAAGAKRRETSDPDVYAYRQRASITRLGIFRKLLSQDHPIRATDLATAVSCDHAGVNRHLKALARSGIVDFESAEKANFIRYKCNAYAPATVPHAYRYEVTLTRNVFDVIRQTENDTFTKDDIIWELRTVRQGQKIPSATVSGILRMLANDGYLITDEFRGEVRSKVSLTASRWGMVSELVQLIDSFQELDPVVLRDGRRMGQKILADPVRVTRLMQSARDASPRKTSG